MEPRQQCPICASAVEPNPRYPRYLCGECASQATSSDGRPLSFYNTSLSGGYRAEYADTREPYDSHACWVRGVPCRADEARFGGIVIEPVGPRPKPSGAERAIAPPFSTDPLVDRARGVLVGLAVGDALGAPVEFEPPAAIRGRRAELFALPGGGSFGWAPGEFTDDTQMALVLASHLRARGGQLDQDALAHEFARWAQNAADVGNQTRAVLGAVTRGERWQDAVRSLAPDAEGNGSLMRVAPVALASASLESALELAAAQSVVTHPNATCVAACQFLARLLWAALATGELDVSAAAANLRVESVQRAVAASRETGEPAMSGWVLHTLTGALWAVRGASSFEDALWRAVALGHDADTVGAVAGALAGARWGMSGIPDFLSARLQSRHPSFRADYPAALVQLADELLGARARGNSVAS